MVCTMVLQKSVRVNEESGGFLGVPWYTPWYIPWNIPPFKRAFSDLIGLVGDKTCHVRDLTGTVK
jgi:hypothetical protein